MSFRLASLGRRGLDEDDVRDFCARVEDELARLLEERASLYAEVRRLRGRAQARNRARTVPAMPVFRLRFVRTPCRPSSVPLAFRCFRSGCSGARRLARKRFRC